MSLPHPFISRAQNEANELHREQRMQPWILQPDGVVARVVAVFESNDTWYRVQRINRDGSFTDVGKDTQNIQEAGYAAQHHASISGLTHRLVEYVIPPRQEAPRGED